MAPALCVDRAGIVYVAERVRASGPTVAETLAAFALDGTPLARTALPSCTSGRDASGTLLSVDDQQRVYACREHEHCVLQLQLFAAAHAGGGGDSTKIGG